jgi:hypothetical protein
MAQLVLSPHGPDPTDFPQFFRSSHDMDSIVNLSFPIDATTITT